LKKFFKAFFVYKKTTDCVGGKEKALAMQRKKELLLV